MGLQDCCGRLTRFLKCVDSVIERDLLMSSFEIGGRKNLQKNDSWGKICGSLAWTEATQGRELGRVKKLVNCKKTSTSATYLLDLE